MAETVTGRTRRGRLPRGGSLLDRSRRGCTGDRLECRRRVCVLEGERQSRKYAGQEGHGEEELEAHLRKLGGKYVKR